MTRMTPRWSRCTWVGVQTGAILHRQSPSQSMHVSAVKVSLTAGDSVRMAISTSRSTPKATSCRRAELTAVSGAVQPQGKREKPKRAEYYDGRDQPQIGAQLFSLPPRPHHIKPWHHTSAAAHRTNVEGFTATPLSN